jgi:copper(I)-binding protein
MSFLRLFLIPACAAAVWGAEPTLSADHPWARATAPTAANGAVFLGLVNAGEAEARVIAVSSPACASAELHGHRPTAGGVEMYRLDGITIPAKGRVDLAPGGMHVMLFGLKAPLQEGGIVALDLTVAGATAPMHVEAAVLGIAALGPEPDCCLPVSGRP